MRRYTDRAIRVDATTGYLMPVGSCAVDVYTVDTTTHVSLFSDNGVTPLSNPVTADANGVFTFFVADGVYDLRYVHSSITTTTEQDVEIFDRRTQESGDSQWAVRDLDVSTEFQLPTAAPAAPAAGDLWEASGTLKHGASSLSVAELATEQSWSAQQTITAPATSGKRALILKGNATANTNVLDIYDSQASPVVQSWFDSAGQFTTKLNMVWRSGTAFDMTFDHALAANRTVTFADAGAAATVAYTLTPGTSGSDINWGATGVLNVPDAGASARGVVTTGSQTLAGAKTFTSNMALSGTLTVTSSNAAAFTVGRQGATDPAFKIDASAASSATGMEIVSAAAASGVNLRAISSGAAENLVINAKGTGTIGIGTVSTGAITLTRATTVSSTLGVSGATTITATSASSLAVGRQGATDPVLQIDAATASVATGLKVTGAAAAGGVAVAAISSGSNEALTLDAKGTGTLTLQGTATGAITLTRATTCSSTLAVSSTITGTSTSASALTVGANGATNPVLKIDASTGSVATGLSITGAATGGTTAIAAIDSGSNTNLSIDGKGTGTVTIAGTSTGDVAVVSAPLRYKQKTETVTAANVITASETGSVFFLNSGTEFASELPAPAAGLHFTFIVVGAPSGASYTITTNSSSNIIRGQIYTLDVNSATDPDFELSGGDTVSFVDAKAVAGDRVDCICDGTNWYVYGFCSVFDGITITTAS